MVTRFGSDGGGDTMMSPDAIDQHATFINARWILNIIGTIMLQLD